MSKLALISEPVSSLEDQARHINRLHEQAKGGIATAATAALQCGEMLLQVKASLPQGQFEPWVKSNLRFSPQMGRKYIKAFNQGGGNRNLSGCENHIVSGIVEDENNHNHRAQGTVQDEWYTPKVYIDLARRVMGGIDLDPASSDIANEVVRADYYFTKDNDALEREWWGRVWLNPPYSRALMSRFIEKMVEEVRADRVESAVMLTHNYTDTAWFHHAVSADPMMCFTRGRIAFESPSGEKAAPTQGQAFFYYGDDRDKFRQAFQDVGFIL